MKRTLLPKGCAPQLRFRCDPNYYSGTICRRDFMGQLATARAPLQRGPCVHCQSALATGADRAAAAVGGRKRNNEAAEARRQGRHPLLAPLCEDQRRQFKLRISLWRSGHNLAWMTVLAACRVREAAMPASRAVALEGTHVSSNSSLHAHATSAQAVEEGRKPRGLPPRKSFAALSI